METAQDSHALHVAFNDIVTTLVNDLNYEREVSQNKTITIEECSEDITNLLSPGSDPTKLRAALLTVQQGMRERTKMAGRAKAKFDRLYRTCQENLQNLNTQFLGQSQTCNNMRMDFGKREQELIDQIKQMQGGNFNGVLAIGSSASNAVAAPNASNGPPPAGLQDELLRLQEELMYCTKNRTKLETFLADRVSDNANRVAAETINTQELVEQIQNKETLLQQGEQQIELLTNQVNNLNDEVEKWENEQVALNAQLDVTKLSLTDAQSMLDQAEIAKINFEDKLTERNNELLDVKEQCFNDKADLQDKIVVTLGWGWGVFWQFFYFVVINPYHKALKVCNPKISDY